MAKQQEIDQLEKVLKSLESIDEKRLFRPNLGDESLQSELEPKLTKVLAKARFALQYAAAVADEPVIGVTRALDSSYQELHAQAEREPSEYIQYKDSVLNGLDVRHEEMLMYWPPFVTAAIEARGFLEDEGIRKEYTKAIENLQKQAQSTLDSIKEESQKILAGAKTWLTRSNNERGAQRLMFLLRKPKCSSRRPKRTMRTRSSCGLG